MSCLLLNDDILSRTSNFITRLLNCGYNSFGFSAPPELFDVCMNCRITDYYEGKLLYDKLSELNVRAYYGRYPGCVKVSDTEYCSEARYWKELIRDMKSLIPGCMNFEVVQDWHYVAFHELEIIIYNLTEDATEKDPILEALNKLYITLGLFIATHTADYHIITNRQKSN